MKPTSTPDPTEVLKPMIRVISTGPHSAKTRVVLQHGLAAAPIEEDISGNVQKIELTLEAGAPNKAVMHTINLGGDLLAELDSVINRNLPPMSPKPDVRLVVYEPTRRWWGRMQSRYVVSRVEPVSDYGQIISTISKGWMAPIGPLEVKRSL